MKNGILNLAPMRLSAALPATGQRVCLMAENG
jgi:hypothetical protein